MAAMQFWGVEIKAEEPNNVAIEDGRMLHLSQATLGEVKKDNEPVLIHVKVNDKKFVLGVLTQSTPQLSFDLVFDQDFEISHNWKNGSVHFLGYSTDLPEDDVNMLEDDSDEEEEEALPTLAKENGAPAPAVAAKPVTAAKAAKVDKTKPQEKDDSDEDDSDEDDDEDDSDEDDDSEEDIVDRFANFSDDGSDDDEDDDDEDEEDEKPAKPESGKKRPNVDAKTPEAKKAKLVTPQKTDGKKAVHTATPHPSKKVAKTSGGDKSTPKSGGQFSCEPCKKSFNSDNALQSHNKAKHAAK